MSKQWPFPHYIDVCHCNDNDLEWKNVSMIYLRWMEFNLWVLKVSCPQKRWSGHDEKKVEDAGYFHGNVKKVMYISYVMDFSRCDEDLDKD